MDKCVENMLQKDNLVVLFFSAYTGIYTIRLNNAYGKQKPTRKETLDYNPVSPSKYAIEIAMILTVYFLLCGIFFSCNLVIVKQPAESRIRE